MKVLWLTHTAAGASKVLHIDDPGRGWIGSLEAHIKNIEGVNLAVAFFNTQMEFKFTHNGVTYYPMSCKYTSRAGKVVQRIFSRLHDSNIQAIKKVIEDFKPDVIHLFGTESGVGDVVKLTSIPIIVHLQGLVNPYLFSWLPKGVSQNGIFFNSSLRSILLQRGAFFEYKLFQKRAIREEEIVRHAEYFFGRTLWDKNFLKLYKKEFQYIHCEEVLRPLFYDTKWTKPDNLVFKIVTTINPQVYKGIEIILETAKILKTADRFSFQWSVIGLEKDNEIVRIIENIAKDKFSNFQVTFKGPKVGEELISELLSADIFIHPSHIDNSPNSVCEAMIIGMPVIASYVGGIPSLIKDNIDGILYNSNDPYDLAGKIIDCYENPALLDQIALEARNTGLKRHDVKEIVDTVYTTYLKVLENKFKGRHLTVYDII